MQKNNINIPEGWAKTTFGNVAEFINGRCFKKSEWSDSGLPIIRIENLNNKKATFNYTKKLFDKKYFIKNGDLLFSWSASLGVYIWEGEESWLNQHIFRVVPHEIDKQYLFYYLDHHINELTQKTHGQGMVHITKSVFENHKILIPPLKEQKRIVKRINEIFIELEEGIRRLKKAKKAIKLYYQSLLKNAFEGNLTQKWRENNKQNIISFSEVYDLLQEQKQIDYKINLTEWIDRYSLWLKNGKDGLKPIKPKRNSQNHEIDKEEIAQLPNLPPSWGYIHFGEIIESIDAGKSFKCDERPPNDSEVGVAKVSAISWGEYNQSESKTCTDSAKINKGYFICEGDFIMSRANTIELVGAVVIVKKISNIVMLSDKTLRISMKGIFKEFALHYLRSFTGRKEIMTRSTGNQDSMRNIGQDRIKSIYIPICSMEEITELCNLLNKKINIINKQIRNIDSQISKSHSLRQAILKKAFSGRLVPQNPSEETAKILLERTKDNKKKLISKPLNSNKLKKKKFK